jgi:predicted amidophosphoribosyltransferase
MEVDVREILGPWELGYALDRHVVRSEYTGDNEEGRPTFDTTYTEAGNALHQLKYKQGWKLKHDIAGVLDTHIMPKLPDIDLILPIPASTKRPRQPVDEIARALGERAGIRVGSHLIEMKDSSSVAPKLKSLATREEKDAVLKNRFKINVAAPVPRGANILLLDDLFDTGATMSAVCTLLQSHPKVAKIYAAAVTKTGKT